MEDLFWIGFVGAAIALLFAWLQRSRVMSFSEGNEKMRKIAASIREGANAYLKHQYTTVFKVFLVVFILLLIIAFGSGGKMISQFTPFAFLTGGIWPMLAAVVGGLGAFITGSATVSDMLFGNFQWDMGGLLNYPALGKYIIVAAQGVGGAAGNMICIHNIVAVCAVLGMIGKEGIILRRTIWPFLLYCLVVGTVCSYLISRVL